MNYVEVDDTLAFHPGYYVEEYIDCSEFGHDIFALKLGITIMDLCLLIDGRKDIDEQLASSLAFVTGTSKQMWINLQNEYDKLTNKFADNK